MAEETIAIAYELPDGTLVDLRKLPWSVVADLEATHRVSWLTVVDFPYTNGTLLVDLVTKIHELHGLPAPVILTPVDAVDLTLRLVRIDATTGERVAVATTVEDVDGPATPIIDWVPTSP